MEDQRRVDDWLPGLARIRGYQRDDLRHDAVAAVALAALLIPHGMAFAELAGVPPVTGLHTTVVALLAYALFGPSRLLLVGPDSSLAPLIAAAITLGAAQARTNDPITTAALLAVLTGVACLLAGVARLGTLAELLSKPVRVGYLNGIAVVMIVSQMPKLLGFAVDGDSTVDTALDTIRGVRDGLINGSTLTVGAACLVVIVASALLSTRIPGVLVAVVGATIAVVAFDLTDNGVEVIGSIPSGVPAPAWPSLDEIGKLLAPALGLAVLTLSDTSALSRGMASGDGEQVDPNREIVALGLVNIAAGLFRGFPVSASTTRTTVARASGGRTQLVGVIGALLVIALLVAGAGLVENLPSAALAAVVVAAGLHLLDLTTLRWMLKVRPSEFVLATSAMVGVIAIGVLEGIVVAIVISIGNFVRLVWRPHDAVLARVEGRKGYHDSARHPEALQIPGLLLFRFDAPLIFANAEHFSRRLHTELADAPEPVRRVVIAADAIADIDTTGAEVLGWLLDELDDADIEFAFAGLKGPVKDRLRRYGMHERIGEANLHSTLGTAIDAYLKAEDDVQWTDWTKRRRS